MHLFYNLLLFSITVAGGCIPLWFKNISERQTHNLLAFSGSFLLSITMLHLLPETFEDLHHKAGLLLLTGFFAQLLIQRLTHGVEHGHTHIHPADHHGHGIPFNSIFIGLSIHAFMEGLPLGFNYRMQATEPSLYLAVAAHKLPEAMLVTSIAASVKGKRTAVAALIIFSLLTPLASILASKLGQSYFRMSTIVMWLVPVVAGAFIHIATTIFFESGTRQHTLTWQKTVSIILGVSIGLATLMFE